MAVMRRGSAQCPEVHTTTLPATAHVDQPVFGQVVDSGTQLTVQNDRRGRPADRAKQYAFGKLQEYIENSDECQLFLDQLIVAVGGGETYTGNHLKLLAHYGDPIFITETIGRACIVNFKDSAGDILYKWYDEWKTSETDERLRIVETAAAVICEDIRSKVYQPDAYMSSDSNLGDMSLLPDTLQCFIEKVVETRVKSDVSVNRKRAATGQALVSACRPYSYISPIILGVGVYLADTWPLENLYEYSVIIHKESKAVHMNQGGYCQYAFDNADFNVRTLTGHRTFHSMGGLRFITPTPEKSADSVLRILDAPAAVSIAEKGTTSQETSALVRTALTVDAVCGAGKWIGYLEKVELIHLFLRAERTVDWAVHLHCAREILPYIRAAGHFSYAMSAQLYLQQMEELESRMPNEEFLKFVKDGYYVFRRNHKLGTCVSLDMAIEQCLMQLLKVQGGLMHGRGISNSQLAYFVLAFPACLNVCEAMERIIGHEKINCYNALSNGGTAMKTMIGSNFADVKLTRKNIVHWLRPPALFDVSMRNTAKSATLDVFNSTPVPEILHETSTFISDGGYLLRVLVWPRPATFGTVAESYLQYVARYNYTIAVVVFDGHNYVMSTKGEERKWCSLHKTYNMSFHSSTIITVSQADFLSNRHNKAMLISMLSQKFNHVGLKETTEGREVIVMVTDTDILIMLLARAHEGSSIHLLSPGSNIDSVGDIQGQIGAKKICLLFVLGVTGCDTTSAVFSKGKKKAWKLLGKPNVQSIAAVFNNPRTDKGQIITAGEQFLTQLYTNEDFTSLDELRGRMYARYLARQALTASCELAALLRTSTASQQHSLRIYLQWVELEILTTALTVELAANLSAEISVELSAELTVEQIVELSAELSA
ncbi:hypothetical protein PR048_005412 [Dryococelus australis]|uniref:Uncharacterized protein n=1 Tax=Dryococelus australis TaxID=614101 RepID=A0ABQ9I895_9NEOP|nr:hypothetical protein PR048_005412 [Dryococelus australis]